MQAFQTTVNKTRIKLYNILAVLTLLYDSENWTIKARGGRNIKGAELKYVKRTVEYTHNKTNTYIAKDINTTPVSIKYKIKRRTG